MFKQKLECVICHKPYDDTFYDKGNLGNAKSGGTRYLCSRECYSKWFDKCLEGILLDNEQKLAQRKRCLEHYYKNKDYWRGYQKSRYAKQTGLAGAI